MVKFVPLPRFPGKYRKYIICNYCKRVFREYTTDKEGAETPEIPYCSLACQTDACNEFKREMEILIMREKRIARWAKQ